MIHTIGSNGTLLPASASASDAFEPTWAGWSMVAWLRGAALYVACCCRKELVVMCT